jgi:hypothetical protein
MRDIHRGGGAASPSEKRFRPMDETKSRHAPEGGGFYRSVRRGERLINSCY